MPALDLLPVEGEFSIGGHTVVPLSVMHGARPILGYRFGRFAYLTDCSAIPDATWPQLHNLDTVVLDALRVRAHPTHFSLSEAIEAAHRIAARQTFFTHMCHDLPHADTNRELPAGMQLAYDGLVLNI